MLESVLGSGHSAGGSGYLVGVSNFIPLLTKMRNMFSCAFHHLYLFPGEVSVQILFLIRKLDYLFGH